MPEQPKNYIGLDISTSQIGICVVSDNEQVQLIESLDANKLCGLKTKDNKTDIPALIKKADLFENRIKELKELYNPERIFLEDFLMNHTATRKKSLIPLAQFNGICQYIIGKLFDEKTLVVINVRTARANFLGKLPKTKDMYGMKEKEFFFHHVINTCNIDFPEGSLADMVDAYITCVGGIKMLKKKSCF